MTPRAAQIVLAANARMPSVRAQSVQIASAAVGFEKAGARTTIVHARRRDTPDMPAGEVFQRSIAGSTPGAGLPGLVAAPCVDWIDRVPRSLQFLPARAQEMSFGRSAAKIIRARFQDALVVARDVEVAHALRARGRRLAWEVHRVPGGRWRRRLARRTLASGVLPIAISGGVADDLARHFALEREGIPVLHDAVDPAFARSMPARAEARDRLGLDAGRPVVLYAGGLMEWKGVDTLVDAARGDALGEAQVLIVGGMDKDVERLRRLAQGEPAVRVDGFRPAPEIPTYLAAADIAVVPNRRAPRISSHYTSPLKVFEAMAAGLPLVVSDLPSLRDVLDDETAVFVEPENPAALGRALIELLIDPDRRERLAAAALARVSDNTWEARAERILQLFRSAESSAP